MKLKQLKISIGTKFGRKIRNKIDRRKINNPGVSIISNHCMGGIIYHDLGLRFNSPTINLKILPDDFIKLVENLNDYMSCDLIEIESDLKYPVAKLKDITIYFVHYKTFEEASDKWNERKKRINYDNIRVMMSARDGCSYDTLQRFDKLPYKKVFFDDCKHPELESAVFAHKPNGLPLEKNTYISDIVTLTGKRAFQVGKFDYIEFLNK